MGKYFQEDIETASREQINQWQNDGLLDVLLFRNMSLLEMPAVFMRVMQGSHLSSKKVLHFKTDKLRIEAEADLPTDIDGEHGEKFPLEFAVVHNRLKICTLDDNMGEEK